MHVPFGRSWSLGVAVTSAAFLVAACGESTSYGSGAQPSKPYEPPSFLLERAQNGEMAPIPREAALGFDGAEPEGWETRVNSGGTRGTSIPEDGVVQCGTLWVRPHRAYQALEMVAVKVVDEARRSGLFDRIRFLPAGEVIEDGVAKPDLVLTLWSGDDIANDGDRRFEWTVFGALGHELVPGADASTEPGVPARASLTDTMSASAELEITGDPRLGFASHVLVSRVGEGLAKELLGSLRERISDHGRGGLVPDRLLGDYEPVPSDVADALSDWWPRGSVRSLRFSNETWWTWGNDDVDAEAAFEKLRSELKVLGFERSGKRYPRDLWLWVRGRETVLLTFRNPNTPDDASSDRYPNWICVRLRIERPSGWQSGFVDAALALDGDEALTLAEAASLRTIVPESGQEAFWKRVADRAGNGAQDFLVLAQVSHRAGEDERARTFLRAADLMMGLDQDSGVAEGLPERLAERWELEFPGPDWTEEQLDGLGIEPWQDEGPEQFTLRPGQVVVRRHPDLDADVLDGPRFLATGRSGAFPDRFFLSVIGVGRSTTWSDEGPKMLSFGSGNRSITVTPLEAVDPDGVLRVSLKID